MAKMDEATRKRGSRRAIDVVWQDARRGSACRGCGSADRVHLEGAARRWRPGCLRAMSTGRPSKLDAKQLDALRAALLQGAMAHDFGTELWTLKRVRVLIERLYGVRFSQVHVWRLLGGHGLQFAEARAPGHRARRGCRREVEAQDLARAQKNAAAQRRVIVFIDESGLAERPTRVRTWAPIGQTPVVQFHFNASTSRPSPG